jgi:hypothetical protein
MAVKCIKEEYSAYIDERVKEFVCDTDTDFSELPQCGTGSTAVSVSTGNVYVVNASGDWKPLGGNA